MEGNPNWDFRESKWNTTMSAGVCGYGKEKGTPVAKEYFSDDVDRETRKFVDDDGEKNENEPLTTLSGNPNDENSEWFFTRPECDEPPALLADPASTSR